MAGSARKSTLAALGLRASDGREAAITGLSVDSRKVAAGHLFVALPGLQVHGATFIATVLARGASAVLTDRDGAAMARELLRDARVPVVVAQDPRQALAFAAALWSGRQPDALVAVTGTNGKTSVATFTRQIWSALGFEAANIGTTGVEGAFTAATGHTTPEPIFLHRTLADMAEAGVTHAAIEASSHGLAQRRLDGVRLDAAGFTNFTQDHLDYHDSFDDYFAAKLRLFADVLGEDGTAVVNIDDPRSSEVVDCSDSRGQDILTVGRSRSAALKISGQRFDATGQDLRFEWQGMVCQVRLSLIGGFQAENVLMAAGMAIGSGAAPDDVFRALPTLTTVRGRMELAATRTNGAAVFVDYAHTPDALATALRALRPHVLGRLIVVFGAGGDRDPGKRVLMGQAAARCADRAIVTDDNPRSEDPELIRAMVRQGCPEATEVGDRAEAILRGVDSLAAGDALLIAGKGHETSQVVGDDIFPFDDREQASVAVSALDGGRA